jgi:hypothetical protein
VTGEKGRQPFSHPAGILHLQQVRRVGQDEGLDVGQPRQQQCLSLLPDAIQLLTLRSYHREDRLGDAPRVLPCERPPLQGGQFLAEEGVRVGHVLVEGTRQGLIQHRPVAWPAGPLQEGIDGSSLVARAVQLDGGRHEGS